jgi:type II secretory pathway pseudopilin PulG
MIFAIAGGSIMRNNSILLKLALLTLVSLSTSWTFTGNRVQAGETTVTGQNGRTINRKVNSHRHNNRLHFDRQTNYPNGKTTYSTGNLTGDRDGNYTGNVTRTNVRGNSRNYFIEGTRTRDNGTRTNNAVITGPNNNQSTFSSTATCNNGNCTSDRTLTYPNGKTRQTNLSGQRIAPGEYRGTVNVTGQNDRTRSGNFYHQR